MRLIDAEILAFDIKVKRDYLDTSSVVGRGEYIALNKALVMIDEQPTIDAVEVVHGEWIMFERPNGGYYKGCSLCTYPMPTDMELDYLCEEDNKYCYNCGAKMDGKEQSNG